MIERQRLQGIYHHISKVEKKILLKIHASGTPPTRVLTVNNPQLAASNMAMQNASVKELSNGVINYGKYISIKI